MLEPFLDRIGNRLQGEQGLRLEWSLQVSGSAIFDGDRISCWVEADAGSPARFASVGRLLDDLAAPSAVVRAHSLRSPESIVQGIGLVRAGDGVEWRLYLHDRDPDTRRERYEALRWQAGEEAVTSASYQFHYFPETPAGEGPADLVHPSFSSVVQRLLRHERLQQLSGFWIRRRGDGCDQVDLAYPWHPPLAEVSEALRAGTAGWLDAWADHPLRHIAFSAGPRAPSVTVYFSAPANGSWPASIVEWKEQIRRAGSALHDTFEQQVFARVPPVTVESNHALGDFYDTTNLDPWRHVLGRELHYHFGLFDESWSPAMPEEIVDEAMERAVTELIPFLGDGRVYDVGCGWGGPAGVLLRESRNRVTGITVSRTQFQYCASLGHSVRCGDVETTLPPGRFDCALLLESLCHVRDKLRLLRVLRLFAGRLVMRVHCQDAAPNSANFGGTMHMIHSRELQALLEEAGWKIVHWRNRRQESMPTIHAWHRRLQSVAVSDDLHLETLRAFCDRVSHCADEWALCNPLMEVVAD